MAALGAATLAGPVYAEEPAKEVASTKTVVENVSQFDLMNMYASSNIKDPRLDVSNVDLTGLEMQIASATEKDGWNVRPTISPDGKNIGAQVTFRYTGGGVKEFLWGLSRPVHLYNHNEEGKVEVLPFYTHPIKAGGALSPLNPKAWKENPTLTGGALAADLTIAAVAYALSQSGDSSDNINYARDSSGNIIYHTDPVTGEQVPIINPDETNSDVYTGGTTQGTGDDSDDSNNTDTGDSGNTNTGGDDSSGPNDDNTDGDW